MSESELTPFAAALAEALRRRAERERAAVTEKVPAVPQSEAA